MKNRGVGPFKWGDLRTELKENTEFDIKKFVTSLDTKERADNHKAELRRLCFKREMSLPLFKRRIFKCEPNSIIQGALLVPSNSKLYCL